MKQDWTIAWLWLLTVWTNAPSLPSSHKADVWTVTEWVNVSSLPTAMLNLAQSTNWLPSNKVTTLCRKSSCRKTLEKSPTLVWNNSIASILTKGHRLLISSPMQEKPQRMVRISPTSVRTNLGNLVYSPIAPSVRCCNLSSVRVN